MLFLVFHTQQGAKWDEEECALRHEAPDMCTKMRSTGGAHLCNETLPCWNPWGSRWTLCRAENQITFWLALMPMCIKAIQCATAAQDLSHSGLPRRDLSEIKATIPADWERTWDMAPEKPLKDKSSEPFSHLPPLKPGRFEHCSNWEYLAVGLAFYKHHHVFNSYFLSTLAGFCLSEQNWSGVRLVRHNPF